MPDRELVYAAFSSIADRYVAVNHLLSFGMDILWRARAVEMIAEWRPARVLDVATGTGDLALDIMRELPEVDVLGLDICEPMLEQALKRGLHHVICADALRMPLDDGSRDAAVSAFGLRNMPNYVQALQEMRRVLVPGGKLLVLDFSMPEGFVAHFYRLYLHNILPAVANLVTGQRKAYEYLGRSIEKFPSGAALCQLISSAGFVAPTCLPLFGGVASLYTAEKPS